MMRLGAWLIVGALCSQWLSHAQQFANYTQGHEVFPHFWKPYETWHVPDANLSNSARLQQAVVDGKLRLSMDLLIDAVVENNLTIAAARYYPSVAQTDLLRARSGSSPRGVDASVIPSVVFAGAVGGSILGTGAGAGGGATNAGGITGAAGAVRVAPAGVFDPSLNLAFSIDHITSPLNSLVVAGTSTVTTTTGAVSVNYVQAFTSGTSVTVSYSFQRQGSSQATCGFSADQRCLLYNPYLVPGFTATVSQQMLNGFGFKVNRTLITVAENEQKIEREAFRQQAIAALVNAKNAYWDLVAAKESVRAAAEALRASQQLAENSRKQFEIGTMAQLDVVTAEAQVAANQRDLIVAETNVQNAELQLKSMFTKSLDEPLASAPIDTVDPFPEPKNFRIPALEEAVKTAKQNRPEIPIAEGNIKSQQDVLPFLKNTLLPKLNLFGLVSTVGLYNVFGTSFSEAVHFQYPQFAFGMTLSFPIRNRQAQADTVRAQLELDQAKDTLARTDRQVEIDVKNAVIANTQSSAQVA
ncbi:MAG: TolC family protein, partial [Acidobacteriia bacterium]|nr:TolC family protein [Terriglobia bacterium]